MKKAALLAVLVFLVSFSAASQIWQYSTEGPITSKPVVFQNSIVVGSDDGKVYGIDPATGSRRWQTEVNGTPNDLSLFDGGVLLSVTSGKVIKLGANGAVAWTRDLNTTDYNVSYVYGASGNQNEIFVTADNGIYVLGKDGSVKAKLMAFSNTTPTAPAAGSDFAVFGEGKTLYRVSDSGQVMWKASLSQGSFWLSKPVIDGNTVYIGALDDKVHAYILNAGAELWESDTLNWVVGTPLVSGGVVYVGSDDGNVYALDASTGTEDWAAVTQLAVQSQPEPGTIGGKDVVFVGSTDKSVYAIARDSGEIVWKGPAAGAVASPLFYQNEVIFGAADGKVYSFSTERACSITEPHEADIVGLKELPATGKYVSESGGGQVMVQINGGDWLPANTTDEGWVYYIDPKTALNPGLNTVSCKVVDSGGEESGPGFTTVTFNQDPTIPLSNLIITVSPDVIEGKPFTIFVNDGDDGSPVTRFTLTFDGKQYFSDRNVTIASAPAAGNYPFKVSKIGFNEVNGQIGVGSSGVNPLFLVVGVLIILIVLWQLWSRVLKQRFAPRRR